MPSTGWLAGPFFALMILPPPLSYPHSSCKLILEPAFTSQNQNSVMVSRYLLLMLFTRVSIGVRVRAYPSQGQPVQFILSDVRFKSAASICFIPHRTEYCQMSKTSTISGGIQQSLIMPNKYGWHSYQLCRYLLFPTLLSTVEDSNQSGCAQQRH